MSGLGVQPGYSYISDWRLLQQILWIFEKELRYALRDTDVFIYSVLVPLLIYPLFIIAAGEVVLWQMGSGDQKFKVAILGSDLLPDYLKKAVGEGRGVTIVKSDAPMADLTKGKIDLVLEASETSNNYKLDMFVASKRGNLVALKTESKVNTAQELSRCAAVKESKLPHDVLDVLTVEEKRLIPAGAGAPKVEKYSPMWIVYGVAVGLLQSFLCAGVSSVCLLAEEKEKETFESTLVLPVARINIIAGKWLAASVLTAASSLANIAAIGLAFLVILVQLMAVESPKEFGLLLTVPMQVRILSLLHFLQLDPWSPVIGFFTLLLGAALSCALCMLCLAGCRTFKEAQAMSMYPIFFMLVLPGLAVIPGIEAIPGAMFLPITNLLIIVKHPPPSVLSLSVALLELAVILYLCIWGCSKRFFAEQSSLPRGGGIYRRPRQQADSI